jgi:serine/threonine-protein kinase
VKPQNVLLNEDGQAKVTDFGIARSLDVQGVTQTGTVLGTSDYIAPEQARGQKVDPKTDMYSLGAVLYELLVGKVPFAGDNFVAVAMRHVNEPVPSVLEDRPDCPARLDLAIQRAMAKDPDDRFQSMDEFVAELEACLAELDGRSDEGATMIVPPARPPRRAARRRPRRSPVTPVLIVLAGALVAAGAFLLLRDDGARERLPGVDTSESVRVVGVAAEDPANDGEHDDEVGEATDKDPRSYWTTQEYSSFDKPGVGLVVDAGRRVALGSLTVESDTPGFPATIRASRSPSSGFVPVSEEQEVGSKTTFQIDTNGTGYRYYEVWLQLPDGGVAHINEVTART